VLAILFADIPHGPAARARELHDNDLLHIMFGVQHEGPEPGGDVT